MEKHIEPNHQTESQTEVNKHLGIKLKILNPKIGTVWSLPAYATLGSAGMDLRACIDEPVVLEPNEVKLIPSGLAILHMPELLCPGRDWVTNMELF